MRAIVFASAGASANSTESGLFILGLLGFALLAAGRVLADGLADGSRNRYKLFLHCSLILTSVIPPELPMELSVAVNTSLLALVRLGVFCTEPFRIPFAGKLDVAAFDKTGTLTSDSLIFQGVSPPAAAPPAGEEPPPPGRLLLTGGAAEAEALPAAFVLGGCHSLVVLGGSLVGDPLEVAALSGIGWAYSADVASQKAAPRLAAGAASSRPALRIVKRFHFSPEPQLRRMTVLARTEAGSVASGMEGTWVLVKGAPETVLPLCAAPPSVQTQAEALAAGGARVLALAARRLEGAAAAAASAAGRPELEAGLLFCGFALFSCPIRSCSAPTLAALRTSSLALVIITGDAALTACHVAAACHVAQRPIALLRRAPTGALHGCADGGGGAAPAAAEGAAFQWVPLAAPGGPTPAPLRCFGGRSAVDRAATIAEAAEPIGTLARCHDLCVSGEELALLQSEGLLPLVVPYVQARDAQLRPCWVLKTPNFCAPPTAQHLRPRPAGRSGRAPVRNRRRRSLARTATAG